MPNIPNKPTVGIAQSRQGIQVTRSNPNNVIPQFVNDIAAVGSGEEFYITFFVAEPPQPTNPGIQEYHQFESVVISKLIMAPAFMYGMMTLFLNILSQQTLLQAKKLPPNLLEAMAKVIKEQEALAAKEVKK